MILFHFYYVELTLINEVDKAFGKLSKLEVLTLSNNPISNLPLTFFTELTALKKVYLNKSTEVFIPQELRDRKVEVIQL